MQPSQTLVKVVYVYNGVECVDTLLCRDFIVNAIADAWTEKAAKTTGMDIDVNPIYSRYVDNNHGEVIIFAFDVDNDMVAGYAMPISVPEQKETEIAKAV